MSQETDIIQEAEVIASEIGEKSPENIAPPTVEPAVSMPLSFLQQIYNYSSLVIKSWLESAFPDLFPRPTFQVGEKVKRVGQDETDFLIIRTDNFVTLLDLKDNTFGAVVQPKDITKITEQEFLAVGAHYGIDRTNYAQYTK